MQKKNGLIKQKPMCEKLKMCTLAAQLTFGQFFAIKYFLKFHKIEIGCTFEQLINTPLAHGYDPNDYTDEENKCIKMLLFRIILYTEPSLVESLIRNEKQSESLIIKTHVTRESINPVLNKLRKNYANHSRRKASDFINTYLTCYSNFVRYRMYLQYKKSKWI
jgi:hypothetical protein